ncbi:MAG: hypothetical protein SPiBPW_35360 [Shewanella algae]
MGEVPELFAPDCGGRWRCGYQGFELKVSKLVLPELPATDVVHCLPQAYAQAIL